MPRRVRIAVQGIPWHIIQRGNNRSPCFYTDSDYQVYLHTLGQQAKKQVFRVREKLNLFFTTFQTKFKTTQQDKHRQP